MGTIRFASIGPMTDDEKVFFQELGLRIASLRKDLDLTQQQLADLLGVSQQMVASYEVGRRRVPVSLLPTLARSLAISVETLLGETDKRSSKRGPSPKLLQQLEQVSLLPKAQQKFVSQVIDSVLQQASRG
jgi:transcriptional regulator with XRE-family HTH domain